mgnify:CR=1 FL=1
MTFNYIVTIHNKEGLLPKVLDGIASSATTSSRLIAVLDGCIDRSAALVEEFGRAASFEVISVATADVHEIRSINAGLQNAKDGYCVILQDDVILECPDLEAQIIGLAERHPRSLGYVSLRLAADIVPERISRRAKHLASLGFGALKPAILDVNHIGHPDEELSVKKAAYGVFHPRMVGIKSPVVLSPQLRKVAASMDERLAPYCYDDVEASLRGLAAGLENGLFALPFRSPSEWGGTRQDKDYVSAYGDGVRLRNRQLVWSLHHKLIRQEHLKRKVLS